MITTEKFIQGNTKEGFKFTIKNKNDGLAVDITGTINTFRVYPPDFSSLLFVKLCPPTDAVNGICKYIPDATNFDTIGTFHGELELIFPDSTEGRIQEVVLIILQKAPTS